MSAVRPVDPKSPAGLAAAERLTQVLAEIKVENARRRSESGRVA